MLSQNLVKNSYHHHHLILLKYMEIPLQLHHLSSFSVLDLIHLPLSVPSPSLKRKLLNRYPSVRVKVPLLRKWFKKVRKQETGLFFKIVIWQLPGCLSSREFASSCLPTPNIPNPISDYGWLLTLQINSQLPSSKMESKWQTNPLKVSRPTWQDLTLPTPSQANNSSKATKINPKTSRPWYTPCVSSTQ